VETSYGPAGIFAVHGIEPNRLPASRRIDDPRECPNEKSIERARVPMAVRPVDEHQCEITIGRVVVAEPRTGERRSTVDRHERQRRVKLTQGPVIVVVGQEMLGSRHEVEQPLRRARRRLVGSDRDPLVRPADEAR
jgi:hypothetical protein